VSYTVIPRVQLLRTFRVLHIPVCYCFWLTVMQVISVFKRLDFAMDTIFMSELYLTVQCDGEDSKRFAGTHGEPFDKGDVLVLLLCYFPRVIYALAAAVPLYPAPKRLYYVPTPQMSSPTAAQKQALDALDDDEVEITREAEPVFYSTMFSRHANNRFALTLLAESCGMASVALEDLKYSNAMIRYILDHEVDKRVAIWFCLHEISTQLFRGFLAIFLSGFFENVLQLNVQALALSSLYSRNDVEKTKLPLWISIISTIVICVLKCEQTVKVIRHSRKNAKLIAQVISEIRPGEDCRSLAHANWRTQRLSMDDFRRFLHFVQCKLTPLLITATVVFVCGVLWAVIILILMPRCGSEKMWNGTSCVDTGDHGEGGGGWT